jgi:hypothetical protein
MINIRKYNPALLNQPGVLYCGRKPHQIGLGNPFSHQLNHQAKFQVKTLEESLNQYQKWLGKLVKSYRQKQTKTLSKWEQQYLKRVLKLAKDIKDGQVTDLICFCLEYPNYRYRRKETIKCHTQILYRFCLVINKLKSN